MTRLSTKEGVVNWESEIGRKDGGLNGRVWGEGKGEWVGSGTYFEFRPIIIILFLIPFWQDSSDLGF